MTVVRLIDFVTVMVQNKRQDKFDINSPVMFSNEFILDFLEYHKKFVVYEQVIKIFILNRKFRLSLTFITKYKIPFQIIYFINAIESNSYDIAFYLLKIYEE